jgi:hypothetical protein
VSSANRLIPPRRKINRPADAKIDGSADDARDAAA